MLSTVSQTVRPFSYLGAKEVRGLFITFEGIEHCGKTTQAELLAEHLEANGHDVIRTHEPGGTPLGMAIRELLLHRSLGEVETVAELLLFAADRAQHVRSLIEPALDDGKIVISDRFFDSTRAYQGYGRRIDMDLINRAIDLATGGLTPNLTILVDIDVVTSRSRSDEGTDDRIEKGTDDFFDRIRNGFLKIAEVEGDRYLVLDGTEAIEELASRVRTEVTERLKNWC